MKQLPIGQSDYKKVIDGDFYYVDKTLFIHEVVTRGGLANLFSRPRRFGKTLNLSMLRYFFEKTEPSNAYLFEDKKIWLIPETRALQGKFPVIFLTFKSVKEETWDMAYNKFMILISNEFERHRYLLDGDTLSSHEKSVFQKIINKEAHQSEFYTSLLFLSRLLERHHHSPVVILIDEYDAPIHEAFINGYYKETVGFMRSFLGDGLKDNSSLQLGVITGILRTAKEGIFSGLNNLEVFTLLSNDAADKFGFTEQEIEQMLQDFDLANISNDFKTWYNGYSIGNSVSMYNPWSSLSCIKNRGTFAPYWVNTSDNGLIKKIIATAESNLKDACAELIAGNSVPNIQIDDKMTMPGMLVDSNAAWSLFLFTGYLTVDRQFTTERGKIIYSLRVPNREILSLFDDIIAELFRESINLADIQYLATALENGDGQLFETLLRKFIIASMSFHDIHEDEPEKSYHLFVLGLLVVFSDRYVVKSNRESGYGRFDIMLIPKDKTKLGLVIEFKKKDPRETMDECADRALEQIKTKNYATELHSFGIKRVAFFGIACHKKEVLLKRES